MKEPIAPDSRHEKPIILLATTQPPNLPQNDRAMMANVKPQVTPIVREKRGCLLNIRIYSPSSKRPRFVLRPESVKYCALLSGRIHGRLQGTDQRQEYDLHHVLQFLGQRNAEAAFTGDD